MVACIFAHLHQVTASSTRVRFFRALVATVLPDQLIQFGLIGVVGGCWQPFWVRHGTMCRHRNHCGNRGSGLDRRGIAGRHVSW